MDVDTFDSAAIESASSMDVDVKKPSYAPITPEEAIGVQTRTILIPVHRISPLQKSWKDIVTPIVHHMKLDIRYNPTKRRVEMRTNSKTENISAIQKAEDFVRAFARGFEVKDAIALLRMEDLFIDTFQVTDVKMLKGDHLSRAIGRISGKDGQTKFAIENSTRTRIVIADKTVHILGTFSHIRLAKNAICSLILGSPPGKVYAKLQTLNGRVDLL